MRPGHSLLAIFVLVAALLAVACGGDDEGDDGTSESLPVGCEPVEQPPPKEEDLRRPKAKPQEAQTALVETSCGPFEVSLDTSTSPKTTSSFAFLVEHGFYEDTAISYINESVIQGGDPAGDRTGGPGYFIDEPPPFDTEYTRGTVAMAKTEVDPIGRSGSQFFVVYEPDAGLPPEFALLGRVTQGMDVVDRIAELRDPGSETGAPREPVVIERIRLTR
jgi:peptidyl-prolyl cis-trans isomerase B (cyclophilin B)